MKIKMYIDGASRGNPGEAGVGFIVFEDNKKIFEYGYKLPSSCTNNIAEYSAFLIGLYYVKKYYIANYDIIPLEVYSDSLLLVNQCSMRYKINNDKIKQAFDLYKNNFMLINSLNFKHILREYNKEADALANKGIDEEIRLPNEIINFLSPLFQ